MLTSETLEIVEGRILGKSPSGIVYDGRVSASGRRVAIKILKGAFTEQPERLQDLWRQMELLRQIDEPRIVRVLGYGQWQGDPFYAMEAVDGQTLEAAARRGISFTSDEILHVAEDVARALQAAWRYRLAHGNLKTSNIFVSRDGQVKVADFGLAVPVGVFAAGPSLRAWSYAAPEQVSGNEPHPQSDLYSLGVILYELVTGRLPIEGFDSLTSMTYQLHYVQPPSPRELGAVIPRDLDALIMKCLAKDPDARPSGPEGLLTALAEVRETLTASRSVPAYPGDDLGDFEIFEDQVIGEGGMGTLYRGRQKSLNRVVAVKVMRDAYLTDAEFMRRFRRE
ncbi:MAG TPA: protein kinase, partial [Planctomycetota bacterium]|nr:protein kinase [Planctomycetota bacterium]